MKVNAKLFWVLLVMPLFLLANSSMAEDKQPSGTVVIDQTQVMLLVGGDIGGGTLLLGDDSYNFKRVASNSVAWEYTRFTSLARCTT